MKLLRKYSPIGIGILAVYALSACHKKANQVTNPPAVQGGKSPIESTVETEEWIDVPDEPGFYREPEPPEPTPFESTVTHTEPEFTVPDYPEVIPPPPVNITSEENQPGNPMLKTVKANGTDQIIFADNQSVNISGEGGVIMINGKCTCLTVSGNRIEVFCDIVTKLDVPGNQNKVYLGEVSHGSITGNENHLVWESCPDDTVPDIKNAGLNNSFKQGQISTRHQ